MKPPGPRRPEALQTTEYGFDPVGFFARGHERYGDAFTVRITGSEWVMLCDPGAVAEVFRHGGDELNSGEANITLRPLIGTRNVLLLDGDEHLARRKLVLPPFHGERMRSYDGLVKEVAEREMGSWPVGRPFAVAPGLRAITFEVILRAVFGVEEASRLVRLRSVLGSLMDWTTSPRGGTVFAFFGPEGLMSHPRFRRERAVVDEEVLRVIGERRADPSGADILSMLLQARFDDGSELSDQDVRDELLTLLLAGYETSAGMLTWAVHELARAPEVADRLAAGEDGLAGAVVDETLRLWPPLPLVLRRLRRPLRLSGWDLPTGTTVAPCTMVIHRRPDLWPSPERWLPDRFLGDGRPKAGTFFPFGGGVRRCVGAAFASFEGRIVLSELARRFVVRPASRRREPLFRRGIVLVPLRGGRVVLERR
jgi:cytochrome P450 family 135